MVTYRAGVSRSSALRAGRDGRDEQGETMARRLEAGLDRTLVCRLWPQRDNGRVTDLVLPLLWRWRWATARWAEGDQVVPVETCDCGWCGGHLCA